MKDREYNKGLGYSAAEPASGKYGRRHAEESKRRHPEDAPLPEFTSDILFLIYEGDYAKMIDELNQISSRVSPGVARVIKKEIERIRGEAGLDLAEKTCKG